jgi:hypothetical protein
VNYRAQLEWAQRCAALIIESGLTDWQLARKKAAYALDAPAGRSAPSDAEIITAIEEYHALYQPLEHAEQLAAQREEALSWMVFFEDYSPKLTGAVAEGWAHAESDIRIEIFVDDEKSIEIFLINADVTYSMAENTCGAIQYRIDDADWPLLLTIIGPSARGRARWNPHSPRLTIPQLQTCLEGAHQIAASPK